MNGHFLIGLGVGIAAGIISMLIDGAVTNAQVAPPPLQCQCSCDGDTAVLEITTSEGANGSQ